jgi:hypothetical protein
MRHRRVQTNRPRKARPARMLRELRSRVQEGCVAVQRTREKRIPDDSYAVIIAAVSAAVSAAGAVLTIPSSKGWLIPWLAALTAAILADIFTIGLRTDRFVPVIGAAMVAGAVSATYVEKGPVEAVGSYALTVAYVCLWMLLYLLFTGKVSKEDLW